MAGGRRLAYALVGLGFAVVPFQLREMPGFLLGSRLATQRFPLLADFEHDREMSLLDDNFDQGGEYRMVRDATSGSRVLSLRGEPGEIYPGVVIRGFPRDWSSRSALVFDARAASGGTAPLTVRLDDFLGRDDPVWVGEDFRLGPQWTRCVVDLKALRPRGGTRTFRLDDIDSILFFLSRPDGDVTVQLDNITLE